MGKFFDDIKQKALTRKRNDFKTAKSTPFKKKTIKNTTYLPPGHSIKYQRRRELDTSQFHKLMSKKRDKIFRTTPSELIEEWKLKTFREKTKKEYDEDNYITTPIHKFIDNFKAVFDTPHRTYNWRTAKIIKKEYDKTVDMDQLTMRIKWTNPDRQSGYEQHTILVPTDTEDVLLGQYWLTPPKELTPIEEEASSKKRRKKRRKTRRKTRSLKSKKK